MESRKACAAVLLVVALAGCSGDGERPEGANPPASESTSAPGSDATSVKPATGEAMSSNWLSLRLPAEANWIITRHGRSGHHPSGNGTLYSVFIGSAGEGFDSLKEVSRTSLSVARDSRPTAELGTNRVVAGVEGITITAEDDRGWLYEFATIHRGVEVSITFQFPVKDAASEAWVDSTLASVKWK